MTSQEQLSTDWLNRLVPHKHRVVRVGARDQWWVRLLRYGLWHSHWFGGTDFDKVDDSAYPYGPCPLHDECWYLSGLSIAHRWVGLTLFWGSDEEWQEHQDLR